MGAGATFVQRQASALSLPVPNRRRSCLPTAIVDRCRASQACRPSAAERTRGQPGTPDGTAEMVSWKNVDARPNADDADSLRLH